MKEKKRKILNSAAHLFHEKGYKATTLKDIAEAVKMEAPSLYNHIQSKHELLSTLLLSLAREFLLGMETIASSDSDPLQKLKEVFKLHIHLSYAHPDTMSLMLAEYAHLNSSEKKVFLELRAAYEQHFKNILDQGIDEGIFRQGHTDLMLFTLLSTLRTLYAWIRANQGYNRLDLEKRLSDFLLRGIMTQ